MYCFDREAYEARVEWFRKARFGMFIHWGLYSIPGRGEWVRSNEQMPEEAYMPYFTVFSAADFDPKAWARAAKQAGMQVIGVYDDSSAEYTEQIKAVTDGYIEDFRGLL